MLQAVLTFNAAGWRRIAQKVDLSCDNMPVDFPPRVVFLPWHVLNALDLRAVKWYIYAQTTAANTTQLNE